MNFTRTLLAFITSAGLACADEAKSEPAKDVGKPADAAAVKAGAFTFSAPSGWRKKEKPRMMSAGGFTSSAKEGDPGLDVDFFHFGAGSGGDIDSNVARWRSQFAPEKDGSPVKFERKETTYGSHKVTLVEAKGTFLSGAPMAAQKTPLPGHALLGAIIESDEGNVFVKLTGPEKEVAAARGAFEKMLGSAFPDAKAKPESGAAK